MTPDTFSSAESGTRTHKVSHTLLKRTRMPVPPSRHYIWMDIIKKVYSAGGCSAGAASAGGAATAVLSPPETKGPSEVEAKLSADESLSIETSPKGTQSFEAEDDIVTRTSPNLAPYNWDMLPSTSSLLRFRHMLNNAKKAEEKNDYIKALKVYGAVQKQM